MHKNSQIAFCKDDKILKVLRDDMLPIGTVCKKKKYNIGNWLKTRCIPTTRTGYATIKDCLQKISIPIEKYQYTNYGVSLTDCYWFYEVPNVLYFKLINNSKFASKIPKYDDIKLYGRDDIKDGLLQLISENKGINQENINNKGPDNTTGGDVLKYWSFRKGNFYLVKQNHPSNNRVAEKMIASQVLCDIINYTRTIQNEKALNIKTADYFYEPGDNPIYSCCYSKCFTDELQGLTTYAMIESSVGKTMPISDMIEYINPSSVYLKEYFDFIILFDFLTENKRTKDDIGFLIRNDSNHPIAPAPLYGFSKTFEYMDKDYERVYKKDYIGDFVNVFGMSPEEQIDYIAKITWIDNRELFKNMDKLKEYFETIADTRQLNLSNLETICNVINHKLYHIENKKYEIAEEEGLLDEYGFDYRDEDENEEYYEDDYNENSY